VAFIASLGVFVVACTGMPLISVDLVFTRFLLRNPVVENALHAIVGDAGWSNFGWIKFTLLVDRRTGVARLLCRKLSL
jgi:hypothetical protein